MSAFGFAHAQPNPALFHASHPETLHVPTIRMYRGMKSARTVCALMADHDGLMQISSRNAGSNGLDTGQAARASKATHFGFGLRALEIIGRGTRLLRRSEQGPEA